MSIYKSLVSKRLTGSMGKIDFTHLAMVVPVVLLLVLFFIFPLSRVLDSSLGGDKRVTLDLFEKALTDPITRNWWLITIEQTFITLFICLLLGYPLAYFLATSSGRKRTLVFVAVIVPFITHFVAQTSIWRVILGRRGLVNESLVSLGIIDQPLHILFTRFSVEVGMIQTLLPFMVLCAYSGMRGIPSVYSMVAQSMGATPFKCFLRIYLPLSMPGVWAGAFLVLVLGIGSFAAPDILGNVFHRGIASNLRGSGPFNSALAMVTLAAVVVLYLTFVKFIGFKPLYQAGEVLTGVNAEAKIVYSGRRWVLGGVVTFICIYLLVPTFMVMLLSVNNSSFVLFPPKSFTLKWYGEYFTSNDPLAHWVGSTVTSIEVALLTVVGSLILGGLVSYALVRGRLPGKGLINAFVILPLVVPTVVTAGAIFHLYYFNAHLNFLLGSVPGLVIPHITLAVPYVVIILTSVLRSIDEAPERAALSLGANRFIVFRRILLPQIYPGIGIAAFLAFLVSFNEVVIALIIKSRTFQTLPMNIWSGRVAEFAPMMAAVSVMVLILTLTVLGLVLFTRKRLASYADDF